MRLIAAIFVVALSGATTVCSQDVGGHALFVRTADADPARSRVQRAAASVSPADVMAQNILEWIQGIYQQGTRKTRQQSDANAYLPPFSTQRPPEKPRPFQVATGSQQNEVTGYPAQRPSSLYTPPNVGYPASRQSSSTPFSTPRPNLQPSSTYVPQGFRGSTSYNPRPSQPSYSNTGSSAFPPLNPPESSSTYLPPQPPSVLPTNQSPRPSSTGTGTGIPTLARGLSLGGSTGVSTDIEESGNAPATPPVLLEGGVAYAAPAAGYQPASGYPSGGYPTGGGYPSTGEGYFTTTATPRPSFPPPDQRPSVDVGTNVITTGTGPGPTGPTGTVGVTATGTTSVTEDDLSHPPHIHNLDVQCSKTMMTINIEFNRAFDGVIYSKGYFMNPECTYVKQNSGLTQYSFTVSLDSCGTQFINDFEGAAGQAYLEHVLVLQNEPGIQEVWDTVRRVRCLWEGNINKALTVNLSVDMLNQEIVTFSGDTATAKLDIQIGKGPFAPAADGLVKIGEIMTLVVSVEGDPGFDLQVRDCLARDEASTNMLQLTDERGCILKPKLFGAFQKTNDTGNTGASIIAYAFFQAFKFPDVMDLFIECNVELCKTNCEPCPEANQQIEPGRRRRSVTYAPSSNTSTNSILLSDPVRVGRRFKVIMLDDLSTASSQILDSMEETAVEALTKAKEVCMSNSGFYTTFSLMLSTLFIATISAAVLYIKLQRIRRPKSVDS
ncbi:uncharacterized protein LOC105426874 isoform X1 [Pogonomyrmex barbatus]|uniref:Uncharacterized protein LOC105426874 isoform X1 n=1 Tax=Pogonomyrmex barbatus TaxID=144034 RepID=A0A6I9W3Y1_9HYME|nr:uncharacterized protein LOC105426874 isoform X1 [Pogonomyrmex barbatus]